MMNAVVPTVNNGRQVEVMSVSIPLLHPASFCFVSPKSFLPSVKVIKVSHKCRFSF